MTDDDALADRVAELEDAVRALRDRSEILEIAGRYHELCDGGWDGPSHGDAGAVAGLFTEDGVYGAGGAAARGRAEIREKVTGMQSLPWIRHYLANPFVRVDGDRATLRVKGLNQIVRTGQPPVWRHVTYQCELVRTGDGWRIASWDWLGADLPA